MQYKKTIITEADVDHAIEAFLESARQFEEADKADYEAWSNAYTRCRVAFDILELIYDAYEKQLEE